MTAPAVWHAHGLWHIAWCWDAVRGELTGRGVDGVAVGLPLTDLAADVAATHDALDAPGRPAVRAGRALLRRRCGQGCRHPSAGPRAGVRRRVPAGGRRVGEPDAIDWRGVASSSAVRAADRVVHPERQRAMAARADRLVTWPCGHNPRANQPAGVADPIAGRVRALATG